MSKRKNLEHEDMKSKRRHVIFVDSDSGGENESESEEDDDDYIDINELGFDVTKILVEKEYPQYLKKFNKLRETLDKREPSIKKILKTPLLKKDKLKLMEFFDIYVNCTPHFSEEKYIWRQRLIKEFKEARERYAYYEKIGKEKHKLIKLKNKSLVCTPKEYMYVHKTIELDTSDENKSIILKKIEDFQNMGNDNEEISKLKLWITTALAQPYNKVKMYPQDVKNDLPKFIHKFKHELDKELYGMKVVKEQLLMYVHTKILYPQSKLNLGLIGEPGTGKTAISRLLASVLDFPFRQISFGGVNDISFLKGHSYTYIGSKPGAIVDALSKMKYNNGILFLDEYEKISSKKDITAALLHMTDPMQNSEFMDFYLGDIKLDLSNLWFIYSMNSLPDDSALQDRIFAVKVPGYNTSDKVKIIKNYILPKIEKRLGIKDQFHVEDNVLEYFVQKVCSDDDKGVRTIEKYMNNICNKLNFCIQMKDTKELDISFEMEEKLSYPVQITTKIIDKMCSKTGNDDVSKLMMYT